MTPHRHGSGTGRRGTILAEPLTTTEARTSQRRSELLLTCPSRRPEVHEHFAGLQVDGDDTAVLRVGGRCVAVGAEVREACAGNVTTATGACPSASRSVTFASVAVSCRSTE
jgi:hypothetical protein